MTVVHHGKLSMPKRRRQRVEVVAPNGVNLPLIPFQPRKKFPLQRRIEQRPTIRLETQPVRLPWAFPWFGIGHLSPNKQRRPSQRLQRFARLFDALIERQVIRNPNRNGPV